MRREVPVGIRTNWGRVSAAYSQGASGIKAPVAACLWFLLAWACVDTFCVDTFCPAAELLAQRPHEMSGLESFASRAISPIGADELVFSPEDKADQQSPKADPTDAEPDEQDSRPNHETEPIRPSPPAPPVLAELTPKMAALRDLVRKTLAADFNRPPGTRENTPTEIIHRCLVFGCDATVRNSADGNRTINAVGCLTWNFPCGGYRLILSDGRRLMARVGHGYQQRPGQFLAVLAQSGVPGDYEVRVGDHHGTVADLVEQEKLDCRAGTDLSAPLIGLSFYLDANQTWENELGQTWSIERIVEEELDREIEGGGPELVDQLLGLNYVLDRRRLKMLPLQGQFARAEEYVWKFQDYALQLQNPDGSWHPRIFVLKGSSNDNVGLLRSSGRILEWLASSLPQDRLDDPQVVLSVSFVTRLLNSRNSRRGSTSMATAEIIDRLHALSGLSIYDRRYFKPRDRQEPMAEAKAPRRRVTTR